MNPINLPLPISLRPLATNTGKNCCFASAMVIPFASSSSERLPSSKYFSIKPSSFSAAISTKALCISLALAISDSGIGFFSGFPPFEGNSYITILAKLKNETNGYGIVFHDPIQNKIIQLLDKNFAFLYKQIVSDFALGFATGSIVGLARERTPADQWHSDTIERNVHDKNSLHQGILRIVDKEDGIPVYINSIKIVGNISPALAYSLKGNPTEIQTILNKYKLIQKHIMGKISEGKPEVNPEALLRTYCAGEGFKSESRLHSINRALSNLTASTDK